jgi:hypothetical protein
MVRNLVPRMLDLLNRLRLLRHGTRVPQHVQEQLRPRHTRARMLLEEVKKAVFFR